MHREKKRKLINSELDGVKRILTGKLAITLRAQAARMPAKRKMKFNCEYLIPQVGLLRISSALKKNKDQSSSDVKSVSH